LARVAVIRGGRSLEREFSLGSGRNVAAALRAAGHEPVELDVQPGLAAALEGMEAAFVALHGRDGEDGTIQSVLEALGLPYTGSDPLACQLCFDKPLATGIMSRHGLATPGGYVLHAEAVRHMGAGLAMSSAAERLGYPLVVKPAMQGSGIGVGVVHTPSELSAAAMTAFNSGERILLERHVAGAELAVTVIDLAGDGDGRPVALPAVQVSAGGVFDFHSRVTPGAARYKCPPDLPPESVEQAGRVAVEAFRALGARDFARVDLIVSPQEGPVILEVNPCPGLGEASLLPLAVEASGSSMRGFVDSVVSAAINRGGWR